MPLRETQLVECASFACLALLATILAYGILLQLATSLWRATPLPGLTLPVALLILLAGTPLVLETGLLLTGSLARERAWRIGSALGLFAATAVLSPHAFFQSLPDPLVNPFVFELITELALLAILAALCFAAPRPPWWALGLVVVHAVFAVYIDQRTYSGPSPSVVSILGRELTLLTAFAALAWAFARSFAGAHEPAAAS